ncbi:MAG: hypothetical protein WC256_10270 [Desulfurivibrionaceae bacterium]|jgi:hypothetical protein
MEQISIRDRNHAAYLVTLGFQGDFVPQAGGIIEAVFEYSPELESATRSFMANAPIPVQSFVAASRFVSDRINQTRKAVSHD